MYFVTDTILFSDCSRITLFLYLTTYRTDSSLRIYPASVLEPTE